jgi:hypothetical protein
MYLFARPNGVQPRLNGSFGQAGGLDVDSYRHFFVTFFFSKPVPFFGKKESEIM